MNKKEVHRALRHTFFDALIGQPEHASDFLADLVRILLDLGIDEFGIYLCGNDRLVA